MVETEPKTKLGIYDNTKIEKITKSFTNLALQILR